MAPLRYLTPFAFLALVPLGARLGGGWTFLPLAATPLFLMALDEALGKEPATGRKAPRSIQRWFPRLYIGLQLAVTGLAAAWVARPSTSVLEAAGLAVGCGVTTGVFGFVSAHEMIHSPDRRERALGLALLGTVFYMHFRIAHVHGHHLRAATHDDPASARLGEGLYAFLVRAISGQLAEAWTFEARRRRRTGHSAFGLGNRMVAYVMVEMLFAAAVALLSIRAFLFLAAVAVLSILLLETFNYVAHYGLSRRIDAFGRVERLAPRHSWNSGRRMNNAALFNMGRHSDHHRLMTRSYEQLESLDGAAELPSGYAAALVTALIPPLWRRVMDPRARAVMAQAGTP